MLTAVKGYYEGGQVFFRETPPVTERTEVIVTFLTEENKTVPKKRTLGILEGKAKLPDDFDEPLDELKDYM
ncbi:MAG: DUF2281 domain-containing protein [Chitinophagaceae bacterium]|nr:MAG: DUF2281 domain-containing protein [Chitinophagaceae bacterium]